ncbi:hypothetical protein [Pseudomonas sp. NPDC089569]|uniref:hypothetical protein n=1 Tax=Pseudomonas sp. NPDC089569 TaxID=3390722 RepID=UPI003D050163
MTWTIKTHPDVTHAKLGNQNLPYLLDGGPVPVLLAGSCAADYWLLDEHGNRPKAHVIISLFRRECSPLHAVHLTVYNSGLYAIDYINNSPDDFQTLEHLLEYLQGEIHHAKVAAEHLPSLRAEMKAVVDRINSEITADTGRAGYEKMCYLFGLKPKRDEQLVEDGILPYGALNALEYPDWTREEIYENSIDSARCTVLYLAQGLHVEADERCRCEHCVDRMNG